MPVPDPLDTIMNVLKSKGSVDPSKAAARSAKLKNQRTVVGANPPATKKPPHQGAKVQQNYPTDAMAPTQNAPNEVSDNFQGQPNMMSVVVDAMNEAIIGLKTEIHRARDTETKRNLEKQAQSIRQQIVEMGGEPIYADESIEEGMRKLRGYGAVGVGKIDQTFRDLFSGNTTGMSGTPTVAAGAGPTTTTPTSTSTTTKKKTTTSGGGYTPPASQGVGGVPINPTAPVQPAGDWVRNIFGTSVNIQAPTVSAPQVPVPEIPPPMTADKGPNYFGPSVNDPSKEGAVDELEELIGRVTGREVTPPPELTVNPDLVNSLITQYGLEPRSEEEIAEAAQIVVERQRLGKEQLINREIERFEREHEQEFAKSQKQIERAATKASSDRREEMAARGMFYSSIMANSLEEIDSTSLELIAEISLAAANRVADLHAELRDVGEWAILEEEFVRREMEATERQHKEKLMQLHLNVATWGDQMALDTWYKQNALQLESDQLSLQGIQVKLAYAEQQGQNLAAAFMADHPLAQNTLVQMGITPESFAEMSLEMQAGLVRSVVGFNEVEQKMRMNELQMRAVVAEIALKNAQLSLQAQIASGQFAMQATGMALEMAQHRDMMDLRWAQHGLDVAKFNWGTTQTGGGGYSAPSGLNWDMASGGFTLANMVFSGEQPMATFNAYLNQQGMTEETAGAIRDYYTSLINNRPVNSSSSGVDYKGMVNKAEDWLSSLNIPNPSGPVIRP